MQAIQKFFQLSGQEKKWFIEASFYCIAFKIIILLVPLKKWSQKIGAQNLNSNKEPSEKELYTIYKISQAIVRSRKIIPWKSLCLTEAISAKIMLRKRNVECTLYLGVNKKESRMIAHAWLKSGSVWITGRKGSEQFTIVSTFT